MEFFWGGAGGGHCTKTHAFCALQTLRQKKNEMYLVQPPVRSASAERFLVFPINRNLVQSFRVKCHGTPNPRRRSQGHAARPLDSSEPFSMCKTDSCSPNIPE